MANIPPGSGIGPLRRYIGASWRTILGYLSTISSNVQTQLDAMPVTTPNPALLADGAYIIVKGRTVTYGQTFLEADLPVDGYMGTDGKVYACNATAAATMHNTETFAVVIAGVLDDEQIAMEEGFFHKDSLPEGFSAGVPFYSDPDNPGQFTVNGPTVPGYQWQVKGSVTGDAKILHFKPDSLITVGRYTTPFTTVTDDGDGTFSMAPNIDQYTLFKALLLTGAFTLNNPTGTPTDGMTFEFRASDDGTARGVTYGANFDVGNIVAATTTVVGETLSQFWTYDADADKWRLTGQPGGF